MRILVAEDARDMNKLIVKMLTKSGYTVDSCFDGKEACEYAVSTDYDAIILDIMMPRMDGHEALKAIRKEGINTPVLFLTARDSISDRVEGLDMGADDYLVKPFDFEELLARVRVMLRKQSGNSSNIYECGDLRVDTKAMSVERGGKQINLIPKEYTILEYMIRNKGMVLTREQIEDAMWNFEEGGSSNNVDVYISRLRKKIEEGYDCKLLHTIRGVGYVLRKDEDD